MNKKFMIGGCAAVAIAGNVFAADEDISYFAPYASLKGGYAYLGKRNDIKYKSGFTGEFELGASFEAWRLGLELGYKSNKIKNFKLPGGFEGTNYVLNGGFDCGVPATANIVNHDSSTGDNANAAMVAIGERSVFNLNGSNAGNEAVFGVTTTGGNAFQTLALKNVTEFKFEKLTAMTGMINVFYDYAMTDAWSIYGGVGLGMARVNLTVSKRDSGRMTGAKKIGTEIARAGDFTVEAAKKAVLEALPKFFDGNDAKWSKSEHSKTVFAWQLMAGVGYEFNENWKLTLGYKLFNTAKVKQNIAGKEYKIKTPFNHTAEVGLTYTF